jgi:hypothetical protein
VFKCAVLGFFLTIALSVSAFEQEEPVTPVSLCELKAHPEAYDHKRIVVQGVVSHEFESFTLYDLACGDFRNSVWLTYGAGAADGILYSGATGKETGPVRVEGFDIVAVQDGNLKRLRDLLNSYRIDPKSKTNYFQTNPSYTVKATLRGRFFAGREDPRLPGRRGYGHLGCCALLAIEQVVSIDSVDSNIKRGEKDCRTDSATTGPDDREALIEANRRLMSSAEKWRAKDGKRVAQEALDAFLKESPRVGNLRFRSCRQRRLTYGDRKDDQYEYVCEWSSTGPAASDSYRVDLLKQSFLKTQTNSWNDITWRAIEVSRVHCEQH